jgi:hypothetical protein
VFILEPVSFPFPIIIFPLPLSCIPLLQATNLTIPYLFVPFLSSPNAILFTSPRLASPLHCFFLLT